MCQKTLSKIPFKMKIFENIFVMHVLHLQAKYVHKIMKRLLITVYLNYFLELINDLNFRKLKIKKMNMKNFINLIRNMSSPNNTDHVYFLINVKEYIDESFYFQELILYFLDFLNSFIIPIIISCSLPLNLICVWGFLDSRLKNVVYKFLLFNSIFDSITLSTVGLRLLVKIFTRYNPAIDFYIFSFLSNVSLTCSNLTKIGFSLERIFKLKSICQIYRKKSSFKYIITMIIVVSMLANSPVLFGYSFYSDTFMKQSYYIMILNDFGRSSAFGIMMVVNAVFVDFGVFLAVVVINLVLLKLIRNNSRKLTEMLNNPNVINPDNNGQDYKNINKGVYFESNGSVYDDESEDEKEHYIILDPVSISNLTKIADDKSNAKMSELEPSKTANDLITNAIDEKEKSASKNKVTKAKLNLTSMIQSNNLIYIFGHLLFSISSIFVQIRYFFHFGNYMNVCFECFYWINLMIILSYMMLYASFGCNFFIYYYQNSKFYSIFKNRMKTKANDQSE